MKFAGRKYNLWVVLNKNKENEGEEVEKLKVNLVHVENAKKQKNNSWGIQKIRWNGEVCWVKVQSVNGVKQKCGKCCLSLNATRKLREL